MVRSEKIMLPGPVALWAELWILTVEPVEVDVVPVVVVPVEAEAVLPAVELPAVLVALPEEGVFPVVSEGFVDIREKKTRV